MQGKRTAVYCRVDKGGNSEMRRDALEMQKRKLERYAAGKGLPITGYYEDDGFPGQDLNRPGLTRLLNDYHAGVFEQVLVMNRSRLYRGSRWNEPQWPFQVCSPGAAVAAGAAGFEPQPGGYRTLPRFHMGKAHPAGALRGAGGSAVPCSPSGTSRSAASHCR